MLADIQSNTCGFTAGGRENKIRLKKRPIASRISVLFSSQ
jgi:hypothetical protein